MAKKKLSGNHSYPIKHASISYVVNVKNGVDSVTVMQVYGDSLPKGSMEDWLKIAEYVKLQNGLDKIDLYHQSRNNSTLKTTTKRICEV
ncbi:MAG: hypothetical protein WCP11_01855 [Candidatus Saccharibacteria bacterium]